MTRQEYKVPALSDEEQAEIIGLTPQNTKTRHFDAKARARFLACLANGWSISRACKYTPVTADAVRRHRRNDADFEKLVQIALEAGTDLIEDEATRRAVDGVDRPIFQGGEEVGVVREYSDSLMAILLKGRRRSVYGDKTEVSGPGGAPLFEPPSDRKLAMALLHTLGSQLDGVSLATLLGPEPKVIEADANEQPPR